MNPPPGGSKSRRCLITNKCIFGIFGFFFFSHIRQVHHVLYHWKNKAKRTFFFFDSYTPPSCLFRNIWVEDRLIVTFWLAQKNPFFKKMAFLPYGFWARYVSGNEHYYWIAQLKSYPMIYNMRYLSYMTKEKNSNMHLFVIRHLLDFDPPGGVFMNYRNQ